MIGVCKRVALALVLILMGAAVPCMAASVAIEMDPTLATTNSIFNIRVEVTRGATEPAIKAITISGLGYPIVLSSSTYTAGRNMRYVDFMESAGDTTVYRVSVTRGLNMSNENQQPKDQRVTGGEDGTTICEDDDNPLLIRDPFGNGVWWAPMLVCDEYGDPLATEVSAIVTFLDTPPDDPGGQPTVNEPIEAATSVEVAAATPTYPADDPDSVEDDPVDWGTPYWVSGCDSLETYPSPNWPELFDGPDPLVHVSPSSVIPQNDTRPDDGSSSTTFEFRVKYYNSVGLPPSPWMRGDADEFGAGMETGVVLYLDYMNVFDPLDELYPFPELRNRGYRPHFMLRELNGSPVADGTDYYYKLQPMARWRLAGALLAWPPTPYYSNEYMSLLIGNYHYFFACSDDSLYFWDGTLAFENNIDNEEQWGKGWGQRSGTALDPSTPIDSVEFGVPEGYSRYQFIPDNTGAPTTAPFMPKKAGRTYSAWGDEYWLYYNGFPFQGPKDWQLYVDRYNKVPGRFEPTSGIYSYDFAYPYPSTEHPQVSVGLGGLGFSEEGGKAVFMNTISPYYRAVNPSLQTDWDPEGFANWHTGLLTESTGATLNSELKFRVKYWQLDNQPPRDIRLCVNDMSIKLIDSTKPLAPENGDYRSFSMKPSTITHDGRPQRVPYDYRSGVEYECTLDGWQLGSGPHTYFFVASDDKATAIYPSRPNDWTWNGLNLSDCELPTTVSIPVIDGHVENFTGRLDNNYFPGPFVNTPCELLSPEVTPASGVAGQTFKFRVQYKDADGVWMISRTGDTDNDGVLDPGETWDSHYWALHGSTLQGQRPYQASVYLDTGTTTDYGYGPGIVKANMVKEDLADTDYTDGCWYVLNTASLDPNTMKNGVRRYKFEFIDDWGRQTDPNDLIKGETTKYPESGTWIEGPTMSDNPRPRLRDGKVESTDGTQNSATLYKFGVKYFSLRDIAPRYVTVYTGMIQEDGKSIDWDSGHSMVKTDPGDSTYSDGCEYIYQTHLLGYEAPTNSTGSLSVNSASPASVGTQALNPVLPNGKPAYVAGKAIVRLNYTPSSTLARDTQLAKLGVTWVRNLALANTYLVKVNAGKTVADVVTQAQSIPSVKSASPDYLRYAQAEPNDPYWPKLWGLRMINAPAVWDFEKGKPSVIVAVVDTGVDPSHPDLQGRLLTGKDTADNDDDPKPGLSGHGTHVAGTIAAQGNNNIGVVGVCWDGVKILPVKVEPDDSEGMPSSAIIDGLEFAKTSGAQVVNMSLGGVLGSTEEHDKIHELALAGIIVVVAAGNDGIAQVSFPGAYDDCIAVAAVNQDENLAFYSNYGPEVDIAAPGGEDIDFGEDTDTQIWSTFWEKDAIHPYAAIQGTSMATPHVAGAAALMLSTGMSPTDVKNKLLWGARVPKSGNLVPIAYGHGILDVQSALTATQPEDPEGETFAPGTYVYTFIASDGSNQLATYVPGNDPVIERRSESAGYMESEALTPTDEINPQVFNSSKFPIAGPLAAIVDGNKTVNDVVVTRWPKGDETKAQVVSRIDNYVTEGDCLTPTVVYRRDPAKPDSAPEISAVLGVYTNPDLTGTNYFVSEDGQPGGYEPYYQYIFLGQELPYDVNDVWIQYRHGDTYVWDRDTDEASYAGDYTLDRWTGTFSFTRTQDPEDEFFASYYFTSRDITDESNQGTIGPVGLNTAPTLTDARLTPQMGDSEDEFTYSVIYKDIDGPNGQAPDFIRVTIDGVPYDMLPASLGIPSYKAGVTYQYKTKLAGGSHKYYFEASDGFTMVGMYADSNRAPLDGPWVNDPPVLEDGLLIPDVLGSISHEASVTYKVTYKDPDNDLPYEGTPKVFVDNISELERTGAVGSLIEDPLEPGKYRGIQIASGSYTAGQFAGKLMQITSGSLSGRVYLIANNTANTLSIMTEDLDADGLASGSTFTIGSIKMFKEDPSQQNYSTGVVYAVTVPQLGIGQHKFHFAAASGYELSKLPTWLTPAPTISEWARFPISGEKSGPTVAVIDDPENPNHQPVLTGLEPLVTPTSGAAADSFTFNVRYSDADNDPPGYHDRLLGYIRVVLVRKSSGATVYTADMVPNGSGVYTTGRDFTATIDGLPLSAGTYRVHFEASDGRDTARYPDLIAGSDMMANDPEITITGDDPVPGASDTRVVATADSSEPETSAPVIDMVSSPVLPAGGSALTMWGADRVGLMRINIWDPVAQAYQTYGSVGFPEILPGMAMWIKPQASYPAEEISVTNPPTAYSPLDYGKLYRLLKPSGDRYDQDANCPISLTTGWNMIGSPYLASTVLATATVTYQGQTKTFAQASSGSDNEKWIEGYAWMWDAAAGAINPASGYKLVHPAQSGALRTIDPWRGYWIKAHRDCTLTLSAP